MNQKRSNIIFSVFVVAAFLFVQLPFSLMHDHGHKVDCVYTGGKDSDKKNSTHFHNNETKPCFVCSVSLVKDFVSAIQQSTIKVKIKEKIFHSQLNSYSYTSFSFKSSRAPPVV